MAIGERHKAVEHRLTTDEQVGRPAAAIPGSRLDFSAHPTDFKINWNESEHQRDASGRFGSGGGDIMGPPVNTERDKNIRQDFANGEINVRKLAEKYGISPIRLRQVLYAEPLPPATKPLPPGVVVPTFKKRKKEGGAEPRKTSTSKKPDTRSAADIRKEFLETVGKSTVNKEQLLTVDKGIRKAIEKHKEYSDALDHAQRSGQDVHPHLSKLNQSLTELNTLAARRTQMLAGEGMSYDYDVGEMRNHLASVVNPSGKRGTFRSTTYTQDQKLRDVAREVTDFFVKSGINAPHVTPGTSISNSVRVRSKRGRSQRSNYDPFDRAVNISGGRSATAVAHEFGHFIEHTGGFTRDAIAWRAKHTRGEIPSDISGLRGERGYKDSFIEHYVGKVYPGDAHTEVVSMGFEAMYRNPVDFAKRAPDHFEFIVDVMRGKKSPEPPVDLAALLKRGGK